MKGDFSKLAHRPTDNFTGVLQQQGRVLLDADWNSADLINSYLRQTLAQDSIGANVVAVPASERDSFLVEQAEVAADGSKVEVTVNPGRGWVGGLHLHLPGNSNLVMQADYFQPPIQDPAQEPSTIANGIVDAVVLEAWEDSFSQFQAPSALIEPALGGPDTTERKQLNYAIKLLRIDAEDDCSDVAELVKDDLTGQGELKATLQPATSINGDCPVQLGGGYTGFEHFFYRIEIAQADNNNKARFKWSRFAGGLVGRGSINAAGDTVNITANDQMINQCGLDEFYLEALKANADGGRWDVVYSAKATISADGELKLDPILDDLPGATTWPADSDGTAFFRLWDGVKTIEAFQTGVAESNRHLEQGIILEFDPPTAGSNANYRAGDYWSFPVRAAGVDWEPPTNLVNGPPQGIHYYRAPLALLFWDGGPGTTIKFVDNEIHDCRQVFQPLTDLNSCCNYTVGDGISSNGQFNSLEQALQHLPSDGGRICLLPGVHKANVRMFGRMNVRITGCGMHTIVQPHPDKADQPLFKIASCRHIRLDNMTMVSLGGTAIQIADANNARKASTGIYIEHNLIAACVHAVDVRVRNEIAGSNDIRIVDNEIAMYDKAVGEAAIFTWADQVLIENNNISVIPAPIRNNPTDPRDPDDPYYDPCADPKLYYEHRLKLKSLLASTFEYQRVQHLTQALDYQAKGGIQIGGGSEQVRVINNRIIGGRGNGITLGHLPTEGELGKVLKERMYIEKLPNDQALQLKENLLGTLYEIAIEANTIRYMGLSGIGLAAFISSERLGLMIHVEDLTIYNNIIQYCAHHTPVEKPASMLDESGFGGVCIAGCEDAVIRENIIENNGRNQLQPVCGVLIVYGEKIDVSNNRIVNNGPANTEGDVEKGRRGGIVITLSFANMIQSIFRDKTVLSPDGIPAIKVHDNVVTQPLGQALFLMAFGPVSVVGNQLTSQGADFNANPWSLLAGSVIIFDLGISKDLMLYILLSSFRKLAAVNGQFYRSTGGAQAGAPMSARPQAPVVGIEGVYDIAKRFLYLPNGNVMFANNQTSLDLRGQTANFAFSSQLIVTLDDVSYVGNQSECTSFIDFVLADAVIWGVTIRSNDNRFQEGFTLMLNSLFSWGFMNMAMSNQATHCLKVLGYATHAPPESNMIMWNKNCTDAAGKWAAWFGARSYVKTD